MPSTPTTTTLADDEFDFDVDASNASFLRCSLATVRASPARHDREEGRALAAEEESGR
jgi:hypothetical protein